MGQVCIGNYESVSIRNVNEGAFARDAELTNEPSSRLW